jgi:hypothetical protein
LPGSPGAGDTIVTVWIIHSHQRRTRICTYPDRLCHDPTPVRHPDGPGRATAAVNPAAFDEIQLRRDAETARQLDAEEHSFAKFFASHFAAQSSRRKCSRYGSRAGVKNRFVVRVVELEAVDQAAVDHCGVRRACAGRLAEYGGRAAFSDLGGVGAIGGADW